MAPPDTLADRYGAPSPARRRAVIVGSGVMGVVFLAWLGWTALFHGDPEVSSDMVTWAIESDHVATAEIDVRLGDDDAEATCVLRAFAEDHTVVGELSFPVDAATLDGGSTLEQEIRTERRATSVELVGCTTPDQQRPR
jgi:Domain of unknown function (DUF4307)